MPNSDQSPEHPVADADGALHLPAFALPALAAWSPQAKSVFMKRFTGPSVSVTRDRAPIKSHADYIALAQPSRQGMVAMHQRMAANTDPLFR